MPGRASRRRGDRFREMLAVRHVPATRAWITAPDQQQFRLAGGVGRIETEGEVVARDVRLVTQPRQTARIRSGRVKAQRVFQEVRQPVAIRIRHRIGHGRSGAIRTPDLGLPIGIGARRCRQRMGGVLGRHEYDGSSQCNGTAEHGMTMSKKGEITNFDLRITGDGRSARRCPPARFLDFSSEPLLPCSPALTCAVPSVRSSPATGNRSPPSPRARPGDLGSWISRRRP